MKERRLSDNNQNLHRLPILKSWVNSLLHYDCENHRYFVFTDTKCFIVYGPLQALMGKLNITLVSLEYVKVDLKVIVFVGCKGTPLNYVTLQGGRGVESPVTNRYIGGRGGWSQSLRNFFYKCPKICDFHKPRGLSTFFFVPALFTENFSCIFYFKIQMSVNKKYKQYSSLLEAFKLANTSMKHIQCDLEVSKIWKELKATGDDFEIKAELEIRNWRDKYNNKKEKLDNIWKVQSISGKMI